ncbi:D-alanyl-D-alanine carboxypeptidase [Candidatus Peregrinibacteria bacterium]|nr:D-alanyl-D-alanine carboxypeptidase [Candidatus Peregrinibacteria bacterium]
MFTSLISLYIASALQSDLPIDNTNLKQVSPSIKTASLQLSNIVREQRVPIKNQSMIAPVIEAKGVVALDIETGEVLYEKNAHTRLPIASITKLMTALIILEENNLDEIVTVSANAANTEGSTMHLRQDEQITVRNILYGIMTNSANDGAVALAEHNAGSVDAFIDKMNKKAVELGLVNTHFSNPIGLDGPKNYSSAYDIAKLGRYVYQIDLIKEAAIVKNMEVSSVSGKYVHKLESTNELLDSYLHVKGLKTGKTDGAGQCFISIAENELGNEVVTVVLNSPSRFQETKVLLDWLFRAYNWNS